MTDSALTAASARRLLETAVKKHVGGHGGFLFLDVKTSTIKHFSTNRQLLLSHRVVSDVELAALWGLEKTGMSFYVFDWSVIKADWEAGVLQHKSGVSLRLEINQQALARWLVAARRLGLVPSKRSWRQPDRSAATEKSLPRGSQAAIAEFFERRIAAWPVDRVPATEAEDFIAASSHFKRGLDREELRAVRKAAALKCGRADWLKPGPRAKRSPVWPFKAAKAGTIREIGRRKDQLNENVRRAKKKFPR